MKIWWSWVFVIGAWSLFAQTGQVRFAAETFEAFEGDGFALVVIERIDGSDGDVSATVIARTNVTDSADDNDFRAASYEISFFDGEDGLYFLEIPLNDDAEPEDDETFSVGFNVVGDNDLFTDPIRATVTILDDDEDTATGDVGEVTFGVVDSEVLESDGQAVFEIIREEGSDGVLSARVETVRILANGASPGSDYEDSSTTITFADGDTTPQPFIVPIINDENVEQTESFAVQITSQDGTMEELRVDILDDDDEEPAADGRLTFVQTSLDVLESDGQALVQIARVEGSAGVLTAQVETTVVIGGGALPVVDYRNVSEVVTFEDEDTDTQTIAIPIVDDEIFEQTESFTVLLTAENGTVEELNVTIFDDDEPSEPVGRARFTQLRYDVSETAGTLTIALERVGGTSGVLEVTADAFEIDGVDANVNTATGSVDFSEGGALVRFEDGQTEAFFSVAIFDDQIFEGTEVFGVDIEGDDSLLGDVVQTLVFIDDDEQAPAQGLIRFVTDYFITDESTGALTALVERIGGTDGELRVLLSAFEVQSGNRAEANQDFEPLQIELVWPDGDDDVREVSITVFDDEIDEGVDEFFGLTLTADEPILTEPSSAAAVIIDDDNDANVSFPTFTEARYEVDEDAGTLDIEIQRSGGTEGALAFAVTTQTFNGGAELDVDFKDTVQFFSFADGEDGVRTFTVEIIDDALTEDEERFGVVMGLLDETGDIEPILDTVVTIFDDDLPDDSGRLILSRRNYRAEEAAGAVVIEVARVDGDMGELSARVVTIPDAAIPDEDYGAVDQVITFADGQADAQDVQIPIIQDGVGEPPERFGVQLIVDGAVQQQAEVIIVDGDRLNTRILSPQREDDIVPGQPVTFSAAVDGLPEGVTPTIQWEVCREIDACISFTGQEVTQTIQQPGFYVAFAYAMTNDQVDDTPAVQPFVVSATTDPKATITEPAQDDINVPVGATVVFRGTHEPATAQPIWFFLNDSDAVVEGDIFTHTFDEPGDFTLIFAAVLPEGEYDEDHVSIRVGGDGTSVRITQPADDSVFNVGDTIQFLAELIAIQSKRQSFEYFWEISNGVELEGQAPTYVFEEPGAYWVQLFSYDPATDEVYEDLISLHIEDAGQPPIIDINLPPGFAIQPGEDVFLRARVIDSRGYRPGDLSFNWTISDGRSFTRPIPGDLLFEQEGEYRIEVTAIVRDTGLTSETVTRTLRVRQTEDSQFEPNESFEQASLLVPGSYGNLRLDENSPIDYYRFDIIKPDQRLEIELNLSEAVRARLYDDSRDLIGEAVFQGDELLSLYELPVGSYFLLLTPVSQLKRKNTLSYSLSVNVLNPALFFPEVLHNATYTTELGIVNLTGGEVATEIIGYDSAGALVSVVAIDIPPRGRAHQSLDDIFGQDAESIAWVQVDADRDLTGYARVESRDFKEVYAVSAQKQLRDVLYAPHIAQRTDQWYTRAGIINGSSEQASPRLDTTVNNLDLTVNNPYTKEGFDFKQRFGGSIPSGATWAMFSEQAGKASLAGIEVFGTLDPARRVAAGLSLSSPARDNPNFTYAGNTIYFTHVARDVETFYTSLAIVNISNQPQTIRIRPFGPNGPLPTKTFDLAAGGRLVDVAENILDDPANTDWLMVEADQPIVGYELFGTNDFKRIAGLEAVVGVRQRLCFPFIDVSADVAHGIAVVNVNPEPTTATFTLYDNQGEVLATVNRELGGFQKALDLIEDIFPNSFLAENASPGWLEVTSSDGPMAGFQLFVNTKNLDQMGALIAR